MNKKIYIELSVRKLTLKKKQNILRIYPVAIGKPSTPTPTGDFKILNKIKNPGGPLGTRWMQFTRQQHGIHGTNQPHSIGQAVSLGCVRMYNSDAEHLYAQIQLGTPVIIRHHIHSNNPEYNNEQNYLIHKVKPGDSLWKLSRKYQVSIEKIMLINNLQGTLIYPGQKLKIPNK